MVRKHAVHCHAQPRRLVLRCDLLPPQMYLRNPNMRDLLAPNYQCMKDQSTWPAVPTPGVNRGYEPKQLRADGSLATVTGTCGPCIYRGDLLKELRGNAFGMNQIMLLQNSTENYIIFICDNFFLLPFI